MPDFATLLSEHIHNKNIKTYALAQYCNLDRSNMYKIIKGQRKPSSLEMVEKMCKFMHLSPSEQADMEESYHIALIGRENYYRRKAVQQFFEEFRIPTLQLPATSPSNASDYADNATLLHSHLEINRSLLYIIASELKKSGGKISLLIQPDYTFLMNILTAGGYASSSVDIDHIIRLNKQVELLDTPGILWPKFEDQTVGLRLALIGSIKDEILQTEELAAELVTFMNKNYPGVLESKYNVEEDADPYGMIARIAESRHCLVRGNELDTEKASVLLMDDFRNGRLGRLTLEYPDAY